MTDSPRKVVIIGGGLSGLSAAFYIRKFYREAAVEPQITLIEKDKVLGGKIETLHRDGFVIEKGPDSFLARKTAMVDLARELELDHELVSTNPNAKKTYILQRGKLHPMPAGLVLGIPTELKPFLKSGLVSFGGKMRAMMDFVLPPRRSAEDESLGDLIERRLGTEVLENMTEPLLAGIYAGDMRKISLQATFPQFGEVERQYGSLIRGMTTGRKPVETHTGTKKAPSSPSVKGCKVSCTRSSMSCRMCGKLRGQERNSSVYWEVPVLPALPVMRWSLRAVSCWKQTTSMLRCRTSQPQSCCVPMWMCRRWMQ